MNKEKKYNHTRNQKRKYRIHKQEELIEKQKYIIGDLQQRIDKAIELLNQPWSFESGNKQVDEITKNKKWEIINLLKEVE